MPSLYPRGEILATHLLAGWVGGGGGIRAGEFDTKHGSQPNLQ
jgi:hypothetical protein